MELELDRRWPKAKYTMGRLYVDGEMICNTLEPPVVGNETHPKGAIPEGVYEVEYTFSPRFKRFLPVVVDVPGFVGIRIHAGNTVDQTKGCIIPGRNTEVGKVTSSQATLKKIIRMIVKAKQNGERIWIRIIPPSGE